MGSERSGSSSSTSTNSSGSESSDGWELSPKSLLHLQRQRMHQIQDLDRAIFDMTSEWLYAVDCMTLWEQREHSSKVQLAIVEQQCKIYENIAKDALVQSPVGYFLAMAMQAATNAQRDLSRLKKSGIPNVGKKWEDASLLVAELSDACHELDAMKKSLEQNGDLPKPLKNIAERSFTIQDWHNFIQNRNNSAFLEEIDNVRKQWTATGAIPKGSSRQHWEEKWKKQEDALRAHMKKHPKK